MYGLRNSLNIDKPRKLLCTYEKKLEIMNNPFFEDDSGGAVVV